MEDMTKPEKLDIDRLVELIEVDMVDKHLAQHYIRIYINPGFKACMTCSGSVRAMMNKLKNWWSLQKTWQFIKPVQTK